MCEDLDSLVQSGTEIETVAIGRGGAQSKIWVQIIEDVLNFPNTRYNGKEAGPAFGAARLVTLAMNADEVNEVCRVPEVEVILDPNPGIVKKYQENREQFRLLYQNLRTEFQFQSGEFQ